MPAQVPSPSGRPFEDVDELTLLACLVAGEARGESERGRKAVAWVARNRVEAKAPGWFGAGYHGVILRPFAFSAFNANDPNRDKLRQPVASFGSQTWAECYKAAAAVYFGLVPDESGDADHYLNPDAVLAVTGRLPTWADATKITVKIDRHTFYRLRAT